MVNALDSGVSGPGSSRVQAQVYRVALANLLWGDNPEMD